MDFSLWVVISLFILLVVMLVIEENKAMWAYLSFKVFTIVAALEYLKLEDLELQSSSLVMLMFIAAYILSMLYKIFILPKFLREFKE